jgi:hypothetical protein
MVSGPHVTSCCGHCLLLRYVFFRLALRAIKVFDLNCGRIHHDTTSVTFVGKYGGWSAKEQLAFGNNKDHRPDLKQLVLRQEILDFRVPRGGDIPHSPQFPQGSQAILVERILVVNREGIPVSTPIVTSLAMLESKPTVNGNNGRLHRVRSAAFEVEVHALLDIDQNPSLRRLGDSEPFSGVHRFPKGNQMCITCHSGHGLLSLNGGVAAMVFPDFRTVKIVSNGSASATARWKAQEPSYALLRGILEGMQWRDASNRGRTRP